MKKLPSIAFIHGWATEPTIWGPVREKLRLLGYHTTGYDMPGYGWRRHESGNVAFGRLVADAMRHLEFSDVWVGWSLGAMVALQAVARKKAPCKGVFAVCPTAKFCCDSMKSAELERLRKSVDSNVEKAVARFRRSLPSDKHRRSIAKQLGKLDLSNPCQSLEDQPPLAGRLESIKSTLLGGLEILKTTDLTPRLSRIKTPVAILSGEMDSIIPCSSGDELHRQIANSTYTTLPCGHVPFLECPQRFMEHLVEFTESISGSTAD